MNTPSLLPTSIDKPTKKSVFFRIKMERVSIFFFFLFSAFCYLSILSFFCLLLFFLLHFATYIFRKLVSLFLSLSTFQVINMGFLNEMWYKGLIQKILGCGDFYFYFLFFSDEKATLYNILVLLTALLQVGGLRRWPRWPIGLAGPIYQLCWIVSLGLGL